MDAKGVRGGGLGKVVKKVDAKECNCVFFIVTRITGWTLRPGGEGSNLSVHWTLTVRNSYFDSPLSDFADFVDQKRVWSLAYEKSICRVILMI